MIAIKTTNEGEYLIQDIVTIQDIDGNDVSILKDIKIVLEDELNSEMTERQSMLDSINQAKSGVDAQSQIANMKSKLNKSAIK